LEQFSIWDEEGIFSAHAKRWLLSERTDGKWEVSTYFGPIFQTLFRELRIFVGERLNTKVKALRLYDWPRKPSDFKYVDEDYTIFLGFIDKALKALDEETLLGELQAPVIPRIPILLPRVAPPALHGPLANIMLVMPRNKQPHPSPKQPADENDGAGMLPNAEQSLKDSPTERRLLHRHPLYQPLGPLR
jgi:hypothetical protein